MKETTNPIITARNKATVEQFKKFVIKKDDEGYSHYRLMTKENAEFWKAQAWFIKHCINTLGMTIEDFFTTTKPENNVSENQKLLQTQSN